MTTLFQSLFETYVDECLFPFNPSAATAAGVHKWDNKLEDYSQAGLNKQVASLKVFYSRFDNLSESETPTDKTDKQLVMSDINSRLLELQDICQWKWNPDLYSSVAAQGLLVIISRNFAPAPVRMVSATARCKQVVNLIGTAMLNLQNPPAICVQVALEQLPNIIRFFEVDVPGAFESVVDNAQNAPILANFHDGLAQAAQVLRVYQRFITEEWEPNADGNCKLGAELFCRKLWYNEMVDTPLDELLVIAYQDLRKNQEDYAETARLIDPDKTLEQTKNEVEKDHPAPQDLLAAFRDSLGALKQFVQDHELMTIPPGPDPIVQETPPFLRSVTQASMDTVGPLETTANESFFSVTLPDPNWSPEQTEEHMAGFNRGTIQSTAVHEVWPGHYLQFLWVRYKVHSKVRKLIGCNTFAEGYAHYCERLLVEDPAYMRAPGLPISQDKRYLQMRLGYLQDALLRNARFVVAIEFHTKTMTFEQAVDFFVKEGFQSKINGTKEVKRCCTDSTFLYYTLGRLEIEQLRRDCEAAWGSKFSMKAFHDRLLAEGYPPLRIVRAALLPST